MKGRQKEAARILREIAVELKAAPQRAHDRAKQYIADLGPNAALVGIEPFALGTLESAVDAAVAHINAVVEVYLEPKRRRRA